jgi:hypothetical protein
MFSVGLSGMPGYILRVFFDPRSSPNPTSRLFCKGTLMRLAMGLARKLANPADSLFPPFISGHFPPLKGVVAPCGKEECSGPLSVE